MTARKKSIVKFKPPLREVRDAFRTLCADQLMQKLLAAANPTAANPTVALGPSLEVEQAKRLLRAEIEGRLFALYALFSLDPTLPDSGHDLALCLALNFVPGFDFLHLERRGTPKRVIRDHKALAAEIEKMKRESDLTIRQICDLLAKKAGRRNGARPAELEAAYYRVLDAQKSIKSVSESIVERLRVRGATGS